MTKPSFYFFGCVRKPGHFFHPASGSPQIYYEDQPFPDIDGGLQPQNIKQLQGPALLHHKDGWTALSFWDRTVDARGGCNGNFLANEVLSFDAMLARAHEKFPEIMARFPFEITISPDGGDDADRD